ncbi:hypothetical protein GCM10027521_05010 [Amycolatopsis cihanbeyliensis]
MWDVTWGDGGPEKTLRHERHADAQETYQVFRAWGSVLKPAGECPWQIQARRNGWPDLPEYLVTPDGDLQPLTR